jgi:methyl-galactoside transport system substrate-binding protein
MAKSILRVTPFLILAFLLGACRTAASSTSEASVSSLVSSAVISSSSPSSSSAPLVPNADKPLAFFGRRPSLSSGEKDTTTLSFNAKTFYVGFDESSEGSLQGQLITDYFAGKKIAEVDTNCDGYLGYVLFVGDDSNPLARARTSGIRWALGTAEAAHPDKSGDRTQEGTVTLSDGRLKVKELVAEQMIDSTTGAYWSAEAAKAKTDSWVQTYGEAIDLFVSNSDDMALGALSSSSYPSGPSGVRSSGTPIFGFDGTSAAIAKIASGEMTGTVLLPSEDVAAGTLEVLRSGFDGLSTQDIAQKGFSAADAYGNKVTNNFILDSDSRSLLFSGIKVTSANVASYAQPSHDASFSHAATGAKEINLWMGYPSSSENDWTGSYHDAFVYYADLLHIHLNFFYGDGASEKTLIDQFIGLEKYDAYAVNLIQTTDGSLYTDLLKA